MKTGKRKGLLFLVILGLVVLPLSHNISAKGTADEIAIRVDGLTCPFCAYGLEKKLKRLEGAKKIHIDIDLGIAHIYLREGQKIEESVLKKTVEDAGFTAGKITYSPTQE